MKTIAAGLVMLIKRLVGGARDRPVRFSRYCFMPACLIGMALLTGCASTSRQKWNSRAGSYTVQQAVADLGRPQKATRLSDGSQVGSWLTRMGTRGALNYGLVRVYNTHTVDYNFWNNAPYVPDEYLRLLFGPDGKLITWDRQYK